MYCKAPSLIQPTRSCTAWSAGSSSSRRSRAECPTTAIRESFAASRSPPSQPDVGAPRTKSTETRRVVGREIQRLTAPGRRLVPRRLHAGVVLLEPASGGQPERILRIERLERQLVLDDAERHAQPGNGPLPEAAVQEELTGVLL